MHEDVKILARRILELTDEVENYEEYKKKLTGTIAKIDADHLSGLIDNKRYEQLMKQYLRDKSKEEWIKYYDGFILKLVGEINKLSDEMFNSFYRDKKVPIIKKKEPNEFIGKVDSGTLRDYVSSLAIDRDELKRFVVSKKSKKKEHKVSKYTVYESHFYAKLSNFFVGNFVIRLDKKNPKLFKSLNTNLTKAGIRTLTNSYLSMMIFSTIVSMISTFFVSLVLLSNQALLSIIFKSLIYSLLVGMIVFTTFYLIPTSIADSKKRDIKDKLPFAIVHMSAVAGSGAPPITMFELLSKSDEYGSLSNEIRKVMNYCNLFGYNLSTALRAVAENTPSPEFKELLSGIVATIETGGDLKTYLKEKADDAINTYKLERKKYTEVISTYSDIYTGVLIAAPLLFLVTLNIINVIGGTLFGLDIGLVALVGTFGFIPVLNIAFILFLSVTQPEI